MTTDYDEMAARYDAGRAFPLEHYEGWRLALGEFLRPDLPAPLLDVGSGTGIWSRAFVEWFGVRVWGVEPSDAMRAAAIERRTHPNIEYLAGSAGDIPLPDESCSAAWLSTVIHHFSDLRAAADELRRVLRPGAHVLIREGFTGRTEGIPWLRYFPEALAITEGFWPTVDDVVDAFGPAGFDVELVRGVEQIAAPNLRVYADQIRVRADSTLIRLTDEEFAGGMERLDRDAAAAPDDEPVITTLDLAVLRHGGREPAVTRRTDHRVSRRSHSRVVTEVGADRLRRP